MRKTYLAPLACLLMLGCGKQPEADVAVSHPVAAQQQEIAVVAVDDDKPSAKNPADMKKAAKQFLQEVQQEVEKNNGLLRRYKAEGLSPEIPAHGRRLAALNKEAEKNFGLPINGGLGYCTGVIIYAESIWQLSLGSNDTASLARSYKTAIHDCQSAINEL